MESFQMHRVKSFWFFYDYVPETNHFSRVHSVAAVLCLQFTLHELLFRF